MKITRDDHPQSLTRTRRIEGTKENQMPSNDNETLKHKPVLNHDDLAAAQLKHIGKQLTAGCYKGYPSVTLIKRTLIGIRQIREQRV